MRWINATTGLESEAMKTPTGSGLPVAGNVARNTLTALLLGAIFVVIVNTWVAFRSVDGLLKSEDLVKHTLQVINQVELIMSAAKDAETGNRGFLITGDDNYLAPYTEAAKELPGDLNGFQYLTSDSPSQQAHLLEMRAVLEQRLALLAEGISERRLGSRNDELHLLVLSGTGKAEMDHLRRLADQMEAEEQRLLVIRIAGAHRSSFRTRAATVVGTVGVR